MGGGLCLEGSAAVNHHDRLLVGHGEVVAVEVMDDDADCQDESRYEKGCDILCRRESCLGDLYHLYLHGVLVGHQKDYASSRRLR